MARAIKDPDSKRVLGVIVADADTAVLEGLASGAEFNVSSKVAVLDADGGLIASSGGLSASELEQARSGAPVIRGPGGRFQVVSSLVPASRWRIAVLLSDAELSARLKPDLAFVDIRMPELDGLAAIGASRAASPSTEWVALTGFSEFEYARDSLRLGAFDYLLKPISPEARPAYAVISPSNSENTSESSPPATAAPADNEKGVLRWIED